MKQTSPSNNLFRHAGNKRGSSLTGIFILNKVLQYVILLEKIKYGFSSRVKKYFYILKEQYLNFESQLTAVDPVIPKGHCLPGIVAGQ